MDSADVYGTLKYPSNSDTVASGAPPKVSRNIQITSNVLMELPSKTVDTGESPVSPLCILCAVRNPLNHVALPKSLLEQQVNTSGLGSLSSTKLYFCVEYAEKLLDVVAPYKKFGRNFQILRSKKPLSLMSHYRAVLKQHKDQITDQDWITFLPEHSICHPRYLATVQDYINRIGATENISCIAFPRKFVVGPGVPKVLQDADDVEKALLEKKLGLQINFCEPNETYEIHELVIRASVVKEFFSQTEDSLVRNKFCDVEFSVFVTEHGRVVKGESALWMLYVCPPPPPSGGGAMNYLGASSCTAFDGMGGGMGVKIRNMYEAAPLLTEYAEMWHVPQLQSTAERNFQILLENFEDQQDAQAFFKFHFERAKQEKPWLQKK